MANPKRVQIQPCVIEELSKREDGVGEARKRQTWKNTQFRAAVEEKKVTNSVISRTLSPTRVEKSSKTNGSKLGSFVHKERKFPPSRP